jgi:hypothetical protein
VEQIIFQTIIKKIGRLSGVCIKKCFCRPIASLPSQVRIKIIIKVSSALIVKPLYWEKGRLISGEKRKARITKTNPARILMKEIKKKPSKNIVPIAKAGPKSLKEKKKPPKKTKAKMLIIITFRLC